MDNEPSAVERIKAGSRHLRGSLLESLADAHTGALREDDTQLIKYHGSYQQDDRDQREERRLRKLEPAYGFMIRTRLPGGVVTPAQWLKLDAIARRWAGGSLRLTTRQAFQLHGVLKHELKATLQAMNAALVDTISACGDVNRNVLAPANPLLSPLHAQLHDWAQRWSAHLLPHSRAYHEIWLDEQPGTGADAALTRGRVRVAGGEEHEPIYGDTYLPRKFKTAFALPPYNDVDVFANDLGFIGIVEDGALVGFNVSAGGGLGMSHGDPTTRPRLADVLGYVGSAHAVAIGEAVVTTQRDWGNRSQRKHARLKYTIDTHGLPAFKAEVERRARIAFQAPRPFAFEHNGDRFGWLHGDNGRWHLGLRIEAGRIRNTPQRAALDGLRAVASEHRGHFRLTANQNLVIADVEADQRAHIDALLERFGLDVHRTATPLRLNALACVALPTCSLAMAEAERYLPTLSTRIDEQLAAHGLAQTPIHLRISGCPNGCSRPYLGEIALVGKAPGRYNLMLGADHRGQRLNRLYRENITQAQILAELDPLFARYADERTRDERFGDFLVRAGVIDAGTSAGTVA